MGNSRKRKHGTATRAGDGGGGGGGARTVRLQELIREELNFLLRSEIRDPRLDDVEVTMVELARDGSSARVWVTFERGGHDEDKLDALDGAAGFLRNDLADSLGLKRTPDLRFRRDPATRLFATPPQETS